MSKIAPMTIAEIKRRIDVIKGMAADDERAHSQEDELYADVLKAIAEGACENPQEAARLCLTTADLDFSRWCA